MSHNLEENVEKWLKFLDPENLKANLIAASLYISSFESLKSYLVEKVKSIYVRGFDGETEIISPNYRTNVLTRDKSVVRASLLWLEENGIISPDEVELYNALRKYRNDLAHNLSDLLFEGLPQELPGKFSELIDLRIKIELWWVRNIDIPTELDLEDRDIKDDEILTSSQIFYRLVFDILSDDPDTANYYRSEFIKKFKKK